METKELEPKQTPPTTYKQLLWRGIVVFLVILSGSAFWWAPRVLPILVKQKAQVQQKLLEESKEQSRLLLDPLQKEITFLKTEITALQHQLLTAQRQLSSLSLKSMNAFLLLAFMDLKAAIRGGEPYVKELNQLKKLTSQDLSPLEQYAESGVPTLLSLINQLKTCIEEMPDQPQTSPTPTFWEKVKARVQGLIKIKKITLEDDRTIDTWGLKPLYLLARQGDIASVLAQLGQKSLPAQASLQTWKTQAETYVKVKNKLDELMYNLFANNQK